MNATLDDMNRYCETLEQRNAELTAKVRWLEEQFRLAQRHRFGRSSERTAHVDQGQLELVFNEAEAEAKPTEPEPTFETVTLRRRKRQGQREELLEDLPVERIDYELPESERICRQCNGPLHEMSTQRRRELKVIPAQVKLVEHIQHIYACRACEREATETPITTAPMPAPPLPKSLASPSMLAHIMNQKFVSGLPLYRQEQELNRQGVGLSRQTLANWVVMAADHWLALMYTRLHEHLLQRDIAHADETTLQVLHEAGRAATSTSYMWVYRSGRDGPHIALYDYQPTRAGDHPKAFLKGFKGYLNVDGYAAYDALPDVTLVGCWAHARRKFDEALTALPSSARSGGPTAAEEGLAFCNRLFAIERALKDATPEQRHAKRQAQSVPVLNEFWAWLEKQHAQALPKSAFGQAVDYCRNQWSKLNAFLLDGRLELDNNRSERAVKPFVIGRKNWLFANTPSGARASAIVYSIVETAKENELNPFEYLTHLFEKLPNTDTTKPEELDALLPWSDALPEACRSRAKRGRRTAETASKP